MAFPSYISIVSMQLKKQRPLQSSKQLYLYVCLMWQCHSGKYEWKNTIKNFKMRNFKLLHRYRILLIIFPGFWQLKQIDINSDFFFIFDIKLVDAIIVLNKKVNINKKKCWKKNYLKVKAYLLTPMCVTPKEATQSCSPMKFPLS